MSSLDTPADVPRPRPAAVRPAPTTLTWVTLALKTALWKIRQSNGATGPGQRPVISDDRAVEAERIVLKVYCPDKLDEFEEELADLKTDGTVRR
ncbi:MULTISPECIES: hypothetical protein [unclassified Streptomyces]|uniref:hypothetical protein n=1 Tax=unclassified Streptomyces TaxID=2593676 RepID=UPI000B262AF6|nr:MULTISPECIES: hypothetical protein [unclassified Streptomyces]